MPKPSPKAKAATTTARPPSSNSRGRSKTAVASASKTSKASRSGGAQPAARRSRSSAASKEPVRVPEAEPQPVDELRAIWNEFKDARSAEARERLILHYAPLVKYVASRVATGLPSSVEQADLVSYGMFGLIDALEKFDLSRQIKFETYAIPRIKGAIIDELRAMDWVPRSVRFKAREIEKAYS
ncbi:MAG: sigma-70 family RNA polymerase sigma factor, partial [Actinomycetota bacterium]|nr:sigma-70 family RNA polymerase sigma factor [Actinomycetota bacterium]